MAPGRFEGSISKVRLSGISATSVFAPNTFAMFSFVFGFELVEKAIVFFLPAHQLLATLI